jgi:hypothetical protein
MQKEPSPPSARKTAFDCPYCGAFTTQHWFRGCADSIENNGIPFIPDEEARKEFAAAQDIPIEEREKILKWFQKMGYGLVFLDTSRSSFGRLVANNLFLSKCYNCDELAVWVHDRLIFPSQKSGICPNPDLPVDIISDFEEAREILGASPRGAAALLRLGIQKLCKNLGEKGKSIDDDIRALVSKGLNPIVQKSLDIVRVIGNEAVHPGTIDLKDDRQTAIELLGLINIIADQMITQPKKVDELYMALPESKRKAIEERDKGNSA